MLKTMTTLRRNGGMLKVISSIVVFFVGVYLIYIYNDVSGQLKETERTAERYRREQETVAAQLQDLTVAKEELKQRCDSEKEQFTNRLSALNQQYKMLKTQHDDMTSEYGRLQDKKEKEGEDYKKKEEHQNEEYNQFKQEKILEVSSLKDAVANLEREKEHLTSDVLNFKGQLKDVMSLNQQLQNQQLQLGAQQRIQEVGVQAGNQQLGVKQRGQQIGGQEGFQQLGVQQGGQQIRGQQGFQQSQQGIQQYGAQQGIQKLDSNQLGALLGGNQQDGNAQQMHIQEGLGAAQGLNAQQGFNPQAQQGALRFDNQPIGGQPQLGVAKQSDDSVNKISLKDVLKQLPVSNEVDNKNVQEAVEREQEQRQLAPPRNVEDSAQEKNADSIKKPLNLPNVPYIDDKFADDSQHEGAGQGDHGNMEENQGPVNLQVQKPMLRPAARVDVADPVAPAVFQPQHPNDLLQQIQPHQPVDDSVKHEQIPPPGALQDENGPMDNEDSRKREDEDDGNRGPLLNRAQGL